MFRILRGRKCSARIYMGIEEEWGIICENRGKLQGFFCKITFPGTPNS